MRCTILGLTFFATVGCTAAQLQTSENTVCIRPGERNAMLALDVKSFDQTQGQGWRLVAERECYAEAAQLIAEYRAQSDNPNVARFHQVQMHAAAEERDEAITLLDELIVGDEADEESTSLYYRRATRAFLANDLENLRVARNDLATLPVPSSFADAVERFKREYPDFPPPRWPPNLDVIDAFIACFNQSYNEAYGGEACRNAGEASAYGN